MKKAIEKKMKKASVLLMALLLTLMGAAQNHDQLFRTPDGKYGTIKLHTTSLIDNVYSIEVQVAWVDKSMNKVDDKNSVIVLKAENVTFTNNGYVTCTTFEEQDRIAFNKADRISFLVNENFAGGMINTELTFEYAANIDQKDDPQKMMFTQPLKLKTSKNIDASNLVALAKVIESDPVKEEPVVEEEPVFKSDVDMNIPEVCTQANSNRFALVIGNEDYNSHQMGLQAEVNVDYAIADAKTFAEYATKVLCIPEDNIILLTDAKAIQMHRAIKKISLLSEVTGGDAELFFYYAGHGFPDEVTKEPYIMPVDVSGNDLQFAINIKELYGELTKYPHKSVTVFLDACFSGGARNQGLLAARGVKIVPKNNDLYGNLVVFSASSGQESSLPYHDKQHGLFTYHLLKKLQETKGQINYRELSDYLKVEVAKKSILKNDKPQHPQVNISPGVMETWGEWTVK